MQIAPDGTTLYIHAFGVSTEMFGAGTAAARWTDYLSVGNAKVGMRIVNIAAETVSTRYFHTDHLGSISVITDENAVVLERLSYDAWGKRRFASGADDPTGSITSQSPRGFTGEEQLDTVALVHLNGRVYDPMVGRMISADPTVPDPLNAQAWNRYSYVGNDPLAFTDPSGFSWLSSFFHSVSNFVTNNSIVKSIIQIASTVILTAVLGPLGTLAAGIIASAASAAIVTGLSGGNLGQILRASVIAGATAFAFNFVGDVTPGAANALGSPQFDPAAYAENVTGHALVGCGAAAANGASCGSGALSGAVTASAAPLINGQSYGAALVENAVLGGAASVAGGGKFANGAVTGAFGYMFNASLHQGYNPNDPNYHYYQFSNEICSASEDGCTSQNVFDSLKSYAAPGQLSPAVSLGSVYAPGAGFVKQYVDADNLTVTNVTSEGHMFDPGQVKRSVVSSPDGSISIITTGEGTGPNRLFNLEVARPAFTGLDTMIRLQTIPAANGVQF
jgi:RHS repeat-associated protein